MKGDDRQHHFDTTHNSTFKPWQLPKITPIVQVAIIINDQISYEDKT